MDAATKYKLLLALHAAARMCSVDDIKVIESKERGIGEPDVVISGYVEYYCGRRINIDFRSDIIDPQLYNRYNGDGVYEYVFDRAI